jgi:hypothetical protein
MKLLQAEPELAPEAQSTPEAEPAARACPTCSATLAPEQDWCLECGAAQPGRLGQRPGWRAAMTVVGLTLLLALGAVAASYAALTDEAEQVAAAPPGPAAAPTTQAPPSVPPAVTAAPPAETAPPADLPSVDVPESSTPTSDPVDVTPAPVTPVTPSAPATTTTPSTPVDTGPSPIAIGSDDGSLYDPYTNAVETTDAKRALDDNPSTSWFGRAADDADSLAFGYVVDLGSAKAVEELELRTKTPGFRVEVYATGSKALPPDVLDERWVHVVDRNDVDATVGASPKDGNKSGDGKERIVLGEEAEGKTFRHVLLWFTQLPESGTTVRISEVSLRG